MCHNKWSNIRHIILYVIYYRLRGLKYKLEFLLKIASEIGENTPSRDKRSSC